MQFDSEFGEFCISCQTGGRLEIYYCPFCGGLVPRSVRESQYSFISDAEQSRILDLFKNIASEQDVLAKYGVPDDESSSGAIMPEQADKPSRGEYRRVLTYQHLSPVAEVQFEISPDGRVGGSWIPKKKENG